MRAHYTSFKIADFFSEILQDESSDEEFEGFSSDEGEISTEPDPETIINDVFMQGWSEGDRQKVNLPFTGRPGIDPNVRLPEIPTPLDFFQLFVTDEDYLTMCKETNRYASQFLAKAALKPHSRFTKWVDCTPEEIKVFLAMTIAMGLIVQLDLSEYWTTSEVNETPFFKTLMSRDRFWLLMSFFHLANNEDMIKRGQPGHDPLFKLGRVYKNIISRFHQVYIPHQELSLDEGMVPWRGNLSFRVYNPDKPKKYGIKAYMICDATNGYCSKFKLYTAKSSKEPSEYGATYDLVMDLMRGYFGKGYHLFMDNYYSSPKLYVDLFDLEVGATGTLRANRKGVPQALKDKRVDKGHVSTMKNENLIISKYHDRKIVYLMSTVEESKLVQTGKINPRNGQTVLRPSLVVSYDKYMGGVDRSDQMVSYATFNSRTLKWWKRVFFHVLSLSVLNSYLLYKFVTSGESTTMLHRNFRKKLVQNLVQSVAVENVPGMSVRSPGRPSTATEPLQRLQGQHFPEKITGAGKKKNITRSCVVCVSAERELLERVGEKRKRPGHESSYQCDKCKTALCIDVCFKLYHTQKDFKAAYKVQKVAQNHDN